MSGDEDVEQRRDKIVDILRNEGYEADTRSYFAEDEYLPSYMFCIIMNEDSAIDEAMKIVDRFHLRKFKIERPIDQYEDEFETAYEDEDIQINFYLWNSNQ